MRRVLALVLTMLAAEPLAAQGADLPAQFRVTGVAPDDRLNIRAGPDASAAILGSYSPAAVAVEVLETTPDGRWGRVGLPEGEGWVSMHYLARQDVDPEVLPRPLTCRGTEPFWSLTLTATGETWNSPATGPRALTLTESRVAGNGYIARLGEGTARERTAIVMRGACSDGMSDRPYGWRVMLFSDAPDGAEVLAGCCTLDGNG